MNEVFEVFYTGLYCPVDSAILKQPGRGPLAASIQVLQVAGNPDTDHRPNCIGVSRNSVAGA